MPLARGAVFVMGRQRIPKRYFRWERGMVLGIPYEQRVFKDIHLSRTASCHFSKLHDALNLEAAQLIRRIWRHMLVLTTISSDRSPDGLGTAIMPSMMLPLVYSGIFPLWSWPLRSTVTLLECLTKWPGELLDDRIGTSMSMGGGAVAGRSAVGGAATGTGLGAAREDGSAGTGGGGSSRSCRSHLTNVSVERDRRANSVLAKGCWKTGIVLGFEPLRDEDES